MWDEADGIARVWWESWLARNVTIVGDKFPGFRQSIVLAALKAGANPEHVKQALVACGDPFPPLLKFQHELIAIQDPDSAQARTSRRGSPANVYHDPDKTDEERDRISGLFEGVSVNGEVIQ